MSAARALLVACLVAAVPLMASAQRSESARALNSPMPGRLASPVPRGRAAPAVPTPLRSTGASPVEPPGPVSAESAPSPSQDTGRRVPRFELAYAFYSLTNGFGGGVVHAGSIGGYFPTGAFRLGGAGELGVRRYAYGPDDGLGRLWLLAGYQHRRGLGPLVPYVGGVVTFGAVLGRRFDSLLFERLVGGGIEIGVDVRVGPTFFFGWGLAWMRIQLGNLGYDLIVLRARLGL